MDFNKSNTYSSAIERNFGITGTLNLANDLTLAVEQAGSSEFVTIKADPDGEGDATHPEPTYQNFKSSLWGTT